MKNYAFIVLFLLFPLIIFSQDLKLNKRIKSDKDLEHSLSGITAPLNLGELSRVSLFTNTKNDSLFAAEYEDKDRDMLFKFEIVNGAVDEERLPNFYFKELRSKRFSPKKVTHEMIRFEEGDFKLNGISSYFTHLGRLINMRVYDAGFWVFVSEVSQKGNDTLSLNKKHTELLNKLMPSKIVEKNPLTGYSDIYYAKACFRDSLMLRSAMSSATNKLIWVHKNVNKYERAAGIPGTFLDYQIAGINGFIDYKTEKNPKPGKGSYETNTLIEFFTKLREAGFIDEFLMQSYHHLLIPEENHQFDFAGYEKWKSENAIEYDVNGKYYLIVNSKKKTDLSRKETEDE